MQNSNSTGSGGENGLTDTFLFRYANEIFVLIGIVGIMMTIYGYSGEKFAGLSIGFLYTSTKMSW